MLYEQTKKSLQIYGEIYSYIGKGKQYREDIKEEWGKENIRPSDRTIKIHLDKAFRGELPLLKIRDKKAFIDEEQLKIFIETLCKDMGTVVTILFTETRAVNGKENPEDETILSLERTEVPIVKEMRTKILEQEALLKRKEEEYQALLLEKEQEIHNLRKEIQNDVAKGILTEMNQKPVVLSSIQSVPEEVFQRNFFLIVPKRC